MQGDLRAVGVVENRRDPFVHRLRYDVGRLSVGSVGGGAGTHAFVDSGGSAPVGPVRGLVFTIYVLWFNENPPGNARGRPPLPRAYPQKSQEIVLGIKCKFV